MLGHVILQVVLAPSNVRTQRTPKLDHIRTEDALVLFVSSQAGRPCVELATQITLERFQRIGTTAGRTTASLLVALMPERLVGTIEKVV
jgi:hypothetical protein